MEKVEYRGNFHIFAAQVPKLLSWGKFPLFEDSIIYFHVRSSHGINIPFLCKLGVCTQPKFGL